MLVHTNPSSSRFLSFRSKAILLMLIVGLSACSLPSLETPACTESRNALREFFSFHFGNDMKFSDESLKLREKYLSPEFRAKIASTPAGTDPFTSGSDDLPKAFRVGECTELSPAKTVSTVLLFWKDDTRTEQREIKVEAIDVNDSWLVNNISR
mgnify:CR=1 FL=1